MNTLLKILLLLGIVGLTIGLILYFRGTVVVEVKDVPVKLDKATYYTMQGFFSTNYYSRIQVEPTAVAEPNMKYLLVLDNGIIKQNHQVSWSQLELAIYKSKTVTNKISQDEYAALVMQPNFTTKMFEVRPQHQMLYLVPGIVVLMVFILSYILSYRASPKSAEREKYAYATPTLEDRESPPEPDWIVDEHGQAIPFKKRHKDSERTIPLESIEYIKPEREGAHMGVWQDINNQKLNRLVQEGRLTPREALEFQRAIEKAGDDFFSQERLGGLLRAIEHGAESERREHDRLPDSILKKYGINPNKFRL